jgi:hypothetical protein
MDFRPTLEKEAIMGEKKIIKKIVEGVEMPQDVKSVEISFGEDSTGMPAAWINLRIEDDYHPGLDKIGRLSAVKKEITEKILERGLSRWPYVRLVAN